MHLTAHQRPLYIHKEVANHNTVLAQTKQNLVSRIKGCNYSLNPISNDHSIKSRDVFTYLPPLKTQNSLWHFKHLLDSCVLALNCLLPDDSPKETLDFYIKQFATYNKIADKWNDVNPSIAITVAWAALQESNLPFNKKATLLKQVMCEYIIIKRATASDARDLFRMRQTYSYYCTTHPSELHYVHLPKISSSDITNSISNPIHRTNLMTGYWPIRMGALIIGFVEFHLASDSIQGNQITLETCAAILHEYHNQGVAQKATSILTRKCRQYIDTRLTVKGKTYIFAGIKSEVEIDNFGSLILNLYNGFKPHDTKISKSYTAGIRSQIFVNLYFPKIPDHIKTLNPKNYRVTNQVNSLLNREKRKEAIAKLRVIKKYLLTPRVTRPLVSPPTTPISSLFQSPFLTTHQTNNSTAREETISRIMNGNHTGEEIFRMLFPPSFISSLYNTP